MNKLLLLLTFITIIGCGPQPYKHEFHQGDRITMKLDGRVGIVTSVGLYADWIEVRFAGDTVTTTGLLGNNTKLQPYSTMVLREWEVEKYKENK